MVRLFHVYFPGRTVILVLSETLVLALTLWLAAFGVFGAGAENIPNYQSELLKIALVVGVCIACMHYYDLYNSLVLYSPGQMATRIVQMLGAACVILALIYYAIPVTRLSQDWLVVWILLAGVGLIVWRRLFFEWSRSVRYSQRTLLLGAGPLAAELAREIESRPELGLSLTGYIAPEPATCRELNHVKYLNRPDDKDLTDFLEFHNIQRVIIAMVDRRGSLPTEQLLQAKARGISVDDGSSFYEAVAGRVDLSSLRHSVLLFSDGFQVSPLMLIFKRAMSVVGSVLGLTLTLPAMALIAIVIRLESSGPAIFRQKRIGKGGKAFTLYKFRSMLENADLDTEVRPARTNDSRCTRVGKVLRRLRLDELPQLFNILRGDMHFVGPRPFAADMEAELAGKIPFYSNRWTVTPGATGWAQVRKGYNETLEDNIEKLGYDLFYIKNLSVGLDFLIVLETIKILLLGRGGR
jgi:sugar transferase (PEP-CTERM system associated)